MGIITTLSEATNIQTNDPFWSSVESLLGTYYGSYENVKIPSRPVSLDLENAWIFEIFDKALPCLIKGDLIIIDGRMKGQVIYNLAIGELLSGYPVHGLITVIGDNETNSLLNESVHDIESLNTLVITPNIPVNNEDVSTAYVTLGDALNFLKSHSVNEVIINESYSGNDDTIETVLSLLYYRGTRIINYHPTDSNKFVDFILNS